MGDDVTDEDMFRVLPPEAVAIRIGDDALTADYHVGSQTEVLPLLNALAELPLNEPSPEPVSAAASQPGPDPSA